MNKNGSAAKVGNEAGMDRLDYDQTQVRVIHTMAYATIYRLYRHNGRFFLSEEEWYSDDPARRIPFFDRTGDSNGEKFEELSESEVSKWLSHFSRTELRYLAREIAEVDQMEARNEEKKHIKARWEAKRKGKVPEYEHQ